MMRLSAESALFRNDSDVAPGTILLTAVVSTSGPGIVALVRNVASPTSKMMRLSAELPAFRSENEVAPGMIWDTAVLNVTDPENVTDPIVRPPANVSVPVTRLLNWVRSDEKLEFRSEMLFAPVVKVTSAPTWLTLT